MEGDATNLAQSALERYGLRGARANPLGARGGDKARFRVDVPRRPLLSGLLSGLGAPRPDRFLLRVHEEGTVGAAGLRSEMLWLGALVREARLDVPEPVPAVDGSLLARVGAEWSPGRRLCLLLRWVPGERRAPDLAPEDARSAGALVARVHRHSELYIAPEGFVRPSAYDWERVFGGRSPLWGEGAAVYSPEELAVFRAAADRVRGVLRKLGKGGATSASSTPTRPRTNSSSEAGTPASSTSTAAAGGTTSTT